jgi:outer membrane protein assembly factor BamB
MTPPSGFSAANGVPRTYYVYITDPDGKVDTVGPLLSDGPGTIWFTYVPGKVGIWTLQLSFAGDEWFQACSTAKQELIVQQEPIPSWPAAPLPTEPWNYPVTQENREWAQITGGWYMDSYDASISSYNPYCQAPASSHILWRVPPLVGVGGLIGGQYGNTGLYTKTSKTISVVMAGRAYSSAGGNIFCYDVRTGNLLWSVPGSFNVGAIRGSIAGETSYSTASEPSTTGASGTPALYSFGTRFIVYDGLTGAVTLNVTGLPMGNAADPGVSYVDPYVYSLQTIGPTGISAVAENYLIKWTTVGTSANFASRIVYNVSLPFAAEPEQPFVADLKFTWCGDVLMAMNWAWESESGGMNATTGAKLWSIILPQDITSRSAYGSSYGLATCPIASRQLEAWDMTTGAVAWISEAIEYPWGNFWAYSHGSAYGMIYQLTYAGVYAFNATNGKIVWHFEANDTHMETPYGDWPFYNNFVIADGKVYACTGEHSPTLPIVRGQRLYCLDAFTGKEIWSIMAYSAPSAVAEGVLFATDVYSGYLSAYGRGETATTVSTSSEVIAKGDSVLLKGTCLDMSPAQNGTAAVSDASMTPWMEYLHMQQPFPVNAKGVTVSLDTLDPNGNYVHIGDATTDLTGQYRLGWQPEIEGTYTIIASFYNTEAYYGSTAETGILVTEAAATPTSTSTTETTLQESPMQTYILASIIVLIIVVLAAIVLLLRRK